MKLLHFLVPLLLVSCGQFPKDPKHTLERVKGDTLRVGIAGNYPSLHSGQEPAGYEGDLVRAFARQLHATVVWTNDTQTDLLELLKKGELDMALGEFTSGTPLKKEAGFSKPYRTEKIMLGTLPGQAVPPQLEGVTVVVRDPLVAQYAKKKGAVPVLKDSFGLNEPIIAAPEAELLSLHRQPSGVVLHQQKLVIAIPKGENGFLMELEKFIDSYGKSK